LAEGKLQNLVSSLGGIADILSREANERQLTLSCTVQVDAAETFTYTVRLTESGYFYVVEQESLVHQSGQPAVTTEVLNVDGPRVLIHRANQPAPDSSTRSYPITESLLQGLGRSLPEIERFRLPLTASAAFRAFSVDEESPVRRPQTFERTLMPGAQGESLVPCLYSMRENEPEIYDVVIDTLRAAFPGFVNLEFPPIAAGKVGIGWKEEGSTRPFSMHQLSDGTVRFLYLATLLASRHLPAVTLIDEPEASMHPDLLRLLVDLMREASTRTQLIVATQSDRLVSFLKPKELLVADLVDGTATFQWGDELDIDHWLKEYSLGDLWQTGVIGGRV
jgi:predicted ATPase